MKLQEEGLQLFKKRLQYRFFPISFEQVKNRYFIQHLQMALSETTCMKARKLCGFHKLILSTNMMAIRNRIYIGGKRLCLILPDFYFNGKESNPIWIIQWNLSTFRWGEDGFILPPLWSWYRWILNRWIVYGEIAQPSIVRQNMTLIRNSGFFKTLPVSIFLRKKISTFKTIHNSFHYQKFWANGLINETGRLQTQ